MSCNNESPYSKLELFKNQFKDKSRIIFYILRFRPLQISALHFASK